MNYNELNLRDYIRIISKQKLSIALTFLIVLVISISYTFMQPVVFKASSTVKIEERKTVAGLLTEWIAYSPGDIMESETRVVKGFPVMKSTARKMGLISDKSSLMDINLAVGQIEGAIDTERIGQTNMIRIIATADSAKKASELANSVAEAYIEDNLADKAKQSRHAREFIQEQLGNLEQRLKTAEERLREVGTGVKDIKMAEPIQNKLMSLQFELADALQKYTDKHPRVIQIKAQLDDLEAQLKSFSGEDLEYGRLIREVEVNKKLYAMLKEKLEEARINEAQKISDVSVVNPAVIPASPVAGNKYLVILMGIIMGLVLGLALAFISESLDTSISSIEDVEKSVKLSVLGVIPSIQSEFHKKQGLFMQIKEKFIPAPQTEEEEMFNRLISHYQPRSSIAEAYRNAHTNLRFGPGRKTILITSSNPSEGKTCIATNLAIVTAQSGLRTLLIAGDLRRPVVSRAFGISKDPGLSELIRGTATLDEVLKNIIDLMLGHMKFEDIIKNPGLENLWIIPSGSLPSNPVELLESKEMASLLEQLKERFDVILIDCAPVLPVTDASILASKVDCTVIVYEIGRTSREALSRTKAQLESVRAKIIGLLLNNTRPQTQAFLTYPYYHYKYRYYSAESKGA